jgi:predicted metal-dependent TIM-barrel fold hydrolase
MKTISNKETQILGEDKRLMKRSDILKLVVGTTSNQGISISEMRDRFKILDVLEIANGEVVLEDVQFKTLKKLFDEFKWASLHKDIVNLADHLEELNKL